MDEIDGVASRVAENRKLAGFTQTQLAARANVSASLIRKVEQGVLPASPAFVATVARALGTSPSEILEQPFDRMNRNDHKTHATIPPIRRELSAYCVAPDEDIRPRSLDELAKAVDSASRHRHSVNFDQLGAELPGLLGELRAAVYQLDGSAQERAYGLLAEAYYAALEHAYKLGYIDLASLGVDRYEWAAARSGDQLAVIVGEYARAGEMINGADWNGALKFLQKSRDKLDEPSKNKKVASLSIWGSLHLKSGLAAARSGNTTLANEHLSEANDVAQEIGRDRDDYRLAFGPTNVGIWSVGLAVESGEPGNATERAEKLSIPEGMQPERVGHHYIDLSRAHLLKGDYEQTITMLNKAKQITPQQTRYHPMVHETIRNLARQRRRSDSVVRLAKWAGVRDI